MDRQRRPYFAIGYATESFVKLRSDISSISSLTFAFIPAIHVVVVGLCPCMADIYMSTGLGLQKCKLEDPIDAIKVNFMKIVLLR